MHSNHRDRVNALKDGSLWIHRERELTDWMLILTFQTFGKIYISQSFDIIVF
jgi:hypothetical protein